MPPVKTSKKWSKVPAPPDAMTGIDTAFDTADVSSQSKPDRGVVKVHTRVYKQDGTLVAEFKRAVLIPKKNPG